MYFKNIKAKQKGYWELILACNHGWEPVEPGLDFKWPQSGRKWIIVAGKGYWYGQYTL